MNQPIPELQLGKYYTRPCIRAYWWVSQSQPTWWPVLGPQHTDAGIINFPHQHYHVDYRFLSQRLRNAIDRTANGERIHPIYVQPIATVWPEPIPGHGYTKPVNLDDMALSDIPQSQWFQWRRLRFKTDQLPPYPPGVPWLDALQDAYAHARLSKGRICPHQGADLSGIKPDAAGIVRCPLHGLCWDWQTGQLAPQGRRRNAADCQPAPSIIPPG